MKKTFIRTDVLTWHPLLKFLIMAKLCLVLIICSVFTVHAAESYAQKVRVNINLHHATLNEVVISLKKQTGLEFAYDTRIGSFVLNKVSVNAKSERIDKVLSDILDGTNIDYKVIGKIILLSQKARTENVRPRISPPAQQKKITGKISDAMTGDPLPGVSVLLEGTNTGVITDLDGKYTIEVPGSEGLLIFSYIGYITQKIQVSGKNIVNIQMTSDMKKIDEVVVVGYGTQKKVSVIGSVSTINPHKLISSNANLSSNLAGQLSGILAVQRSGEPGSDQSDFWIRGISTFNSNSQKALVLVDGVERDMNNVDPIDIESFSILKDATATAIYGVRGANGVVLINTKKGRAGKPQVQIQLEQSINAPVKLPSYVDGAKFMEVYNEACRNSGVAEKYTQNQIDKTRTGADPDLYPNVNWLHEVFSDYSQDQKVNLNVSGGTEHIRYYVSGAYLHQDGILRTAEMEDSKSKLKVDRFNFRSNIDVDLTNTTLFKLNLGGYYKEKNQPGNSASDIFYSALSVTPISYPKIYSDGSFAHLPGTQMSPWIASTHSGYSMNTESQIESTISLEQKLDFIVKGLSAKGLFSFDSYNNQVTVLRKNPTTYYATGRNPDGSLIFRTEEGTDYISLTRESNPGSHSTYMEGQINYNTKIDKHNISALLLYNQSSSKSTPATSEVGSLPYRNNGLAGRLTYNYADRYFMEGNFGYNGSENFAPGKKYGFFPSIAAGWLISSENFFSNIREVVNNLKIKGSYGLVGNDQISANRRFGYLTLLSTGFNGYSYGSDGKYTWGGIGVSEYGDMNMTWEKAKKTNLGLDLGLWNMIDLSVDVYKEYRKNIYMRMNSIPASSGFTNLPYANLGEMSNRGIDMSLIVNRRLSEDLFLSVNSSFTYARNKIEKMDEPETKYAYQNQTGKRYGQIFGLVAERLYTKNDFNADGTLKTGIATPKFMNKVYPGDIMYEDYNKDGVVDSYDRVAIGYANNPEIVYGMGATVQYKNFDFGFLIQGVAHTSLMLGNDASGVSSFFFPCQSSGTQGNILSNIDSRWTEENPSQNVFWPRLSTNGVNTNNNQPSTWWLRDASFWRLKNIELGYKINAFKDKISLLRVYLRGTNLYTYSKDFKDLWDPEMNSANGMSYPANMVVTLGCEIKF